MPETVVRGLLSLFPGPPAESQPAILYRILTTAVADSRALTLDGHSYAMPYPMEIVAWMVVERVYGPKSDENGINGSFSDMLMDAILGDLRSHRRYKEVVNEVYDPSWEQIKQPKTGFNIYRSGIDLRTEDAGDIFRLWTPGDVISIAAMEPGHTVVFIKAEANRVLKVSDSRVTVLQEPMEDKITSDLVFFFRKKAVLQRAVATGSPVRCGNAATQDDVARDLAVAHRVQMHLNMPLVRVPAVVPQQQQPHPPPPQQPQQQPAVPVQNQQPAQQQPNQQPLPRQPPNQFICTFGRVPQMRGVVTVDDRGTEVAATNVWGEEIRFAPSVKEPGKLICSRKSKKKGHKCSNAVFLTRPFNIKDVENAISKMEPSCRWNVVR